MRVRTKIANSPRHFKSAGFLAIILHLTLFDSTAQTPDSVVTPVNRTRLTMALAGGGLTYAGSMIGLSEAWYGQYSSQSFRFFNDAAEWKQVDKLGHFYSAFHISSVISRGLQWSHVLKSRSDIAGAVTSLLMISSVEVFDGYSAGYGASATDLLANLCGSALYLGQRLTWEEIRIQPKFSFHQTRFPGQNPKKLLGSGFSEELLKDYNGQTYWLSVDIDRFFHFPKWLNLSVGYGASDMVYARDLQNEQAGYHPFRRYFLGLDFDLTAIRTRSKFLKGLIFCFNTIRLPAPALEISQGKVKGHFYYF